MRIQVFYNSILNAHSSGQTRTISLFISSVFNFHFSSYVLRLATHLYSIAFTTILSLLFIVLLPMKNHIVTFAEAQHIEIDNV